MAKVSHPPTSEDDVFAIAVCQTMTNSFRDLFSRSSPFCAENNGRDTETGRGRSCPLSARSQKDGECCKLWTGTRVCS